MNGESALRASKFDGLAGKHGYGYWSIEVKRTYEIPNSKHQITNKFQIPILNDENRFGPPEADWSFFLFDI